LSSSYFNTGLNIFAAISRRYWLVGFFKRNGLAVAREIFILAPIVWLTWRTRRE
jgi:hypothetical protein